MPRSVEPIIAELFSNGDPPGSLRRFVWHVIWRRRRPFLMLPLEPWSAQVSLKLYSAQRRRAKIWRAAFPFLVNSPAGRFFRRVHVEVAENSEFGRFLTAQSGLPFDELPVPAIKFGGIANQSLRLVLLLCDQTNRPLKVIKVGIGAAGRAATEREADLLERLPDGVLGCIRVTGRVATSNVSAFATDYFSGESPRDDAGMEILFHSWINPGAVRMIESFEAWRQLETEVAASAPAAWAVLRAALAGKNFHGTLYHGDFAPWNIRAVNSKNLHAFDWEQGQLQGIPGWDWFHFVIQTSVLARRHSAVRVAAEVEELLQSPRFKHYAQSAGIQSVVKPLVLAHLLHHRWVVRPQEGARRVQELYDLLAARWDLLPPSQGESAAHLSGIAAPAPQGAAMAGLWAQAREQLLAGWSQLANVFWEPTLTARNPPSLAAQIKSGWPLLLLNVGLLAIPSGVLLFYNAHLSLLPFYAIPCLLATWNLNRQWGTLFACLAAPLGPIVMAIDQPDFRDPALFCWNTCMRFIIFRMCVFLADRIHRQKDFWRRLASPTRRSADFSGNWAIVLASALWFAAIAAGDTWTGPRVMFLPLYLLPSILITLFLNLNWGALVVVLGVFNAALEQYVTRFNPDFFEVFTWNMIMHFLVMFLVVLLVDRLREENVLFPTRSVNSGASVAEAGRPPVG